MDLKKSFDAFAKREGFDPAGLANVVKELMEATHALARGAYEAGVKDMAEDSKSHIRVLLTMIAGEPARCKCGREIWFIRMKSGRCSPITDEGLSHFADCPNAADFRKGKDSVESDL